MSEISVLISFYNPGHKLLATLASLRKALDRFSEYEVVLIDDGSTDYSADLVKTALLENPRYRLLQNSCNKGLSYSLHVGVSICRFEYIYRIDCGDLLVDNASLIEKVRFLEDNKDYGLVGSHLKTRNRRPVYGTLNKWILKNPVAVACALGLYNPIIHSTVVARRDSILEAGNYDKSLKTCQDYDLWLRLSKKSKLVVFSVEDTVAEDDESSISNQRRLKQLDDHALVVWKASDLPGEVSMNKQQVHQIIAAYIFGMKRSEGVVTYLWLAYGLLNIVGRRVRSVRETERSASAGLFCFLLVLPLVGRSLCQGRGPRCAHGFSKS